YQAKLGIGDRCEIEWFVGPHSINGVGTYAFLHRHLEFRNQDSAEVLEKLNSLTDEQRNRLRQKVIEHMRSNPNESREGRTEILRRYLEEILAEKKGE
ncbi:MAG: hypothetical protein HKN23_14765, partial [Verrucomicrobiales bacterium]|nr:hypothetical protein [Verrucomicrobiales bacterium]